ncbi:hypothetical protein D9X91_07785 [Falsibacillus albus]|uniref:Uncharacterized protein n=1 Tax=Falsibacillus albus TaxID=2478915 RepID=A0A3L7JZI8_9BACI|nr:hypothetical protein D9X91_07785 [Falsibacillus albus]
MRLGQKCFNRRKSRTIIRNLTLDFGFVRVFLVKACLLVFDTFQLLIGVQDEDSGGISGTGETPQRSEEAHRPPRGKRSLARKSTAV